ncbi:hypothetical protein AAMO2058_001497200 [Amorphochlora amoebiformis]
MPSHTTSLILSVALALFLSLYLFHSSQSKSLAAPMATSPRVRFSVSSPSRCHGQVTRSSRLDRLAGRRVRAMEVPAGGEGVPGETEGDAMPPGFWEYALRDSDLGRGQRRILSVATPFSQKGGKKIIIARVGKEGGIFAFDYMCPHLGVSLADGKFGVTEDGCTIQCSQHNSVFNIETGKCEDWLPGNAFSLNSFQRMVTPATNLKTYPTLVRDGSVFVDMSQSTVRGNFEDWLEDRPKMRK